MRIYLLYRISIFEHDVIYRIVQENIYKVFYLWPTKKSSKVDVFHYWLCIPKLLKKYEDHKPLKYQAPNTRFKVKQGDNVEWIGNFIVLAVNFDVATVRIIPQL